MRSEPFSSYEFIRIEMKILHSECKREWIHQFQKQNKAKKNSLTLIKILLTS